jgi:hypothetical protein
MGSPIRFRTRVGIGVASIDAIELSGPVCAHVARPSLSQGSRDWSLPTSE